MTALNHQDLIGIVHGAAVFACGGGGSVAEAMQFVNQIIHSKTSLVLLEPDEVPHTFLCVPFILGAHITEQNTITTKPATPVEISDTGIAYAVNRLSALVDHPIQGFVSAETGPVLLAVAMYAAWQSCSTGAFLVDADPVGRCVPEACLTGFMLRGLASAPIAACNHRGEKIDILQLPDPRRAENLLHALARESGGRVHGAYHPLSMADMRTGLLCGTVSRAKEAGRVMREVTRAGGDVAAAVAELEGGRIVFRECVNMVRAREEPGFTAGEVGVEGENEFAGMGFSLMYKNESMAGWVNEVLFVTIPEIICVFDADKGAPMDNVGLHVGMRVVVVVLPGPALFMTEQGLEVFGPKYIGLDVPFKSAL